MSVGREERKEAKMIGLTPYPVLCRRFKATLYHKSFEISLIRSFTSASVMPVAMAIISTDAPEANNLRIVAFFSLASPFASPFSSAVSIEFLMSR